MDELCLGVAGGGGPDARMQLCFTHDDDLIEISCTVSFDKNGSVTADDRVTVAPGDLPDDRLSARILDALVDEHGRLDGTGQSRGWLRKRRANSTS